MVDTGSGIPCGLGHTRRIYLGHVSLALLRLLAQVRGPCLHTSQDHVRGQR